MLPDIIIFAETEITAREWAKDHNILAGNYVWFDANKVNAADYIGGLSTVIVLPQE